MKTQQAQQHSPEQSAAVILDELGKIQDCDGPVEQLFGYPATELVSRHISELLPDLASLDLVENGQLNAHLRFHCRIGCRFRARTRDGGSFDSLLFLNDLGNAGAHRLRLIVCRPA